MPLARPLRILRGAFVDPHPANDAGRQVLPGEE
jgi:hypothetical protein